MTTLNEGRNEIRIGNSDAKCLLENWVEEVSTSFSLHDVYFIVRLTLVRQLATFWNLNM